jgi:superfamily II DNA or RNA helicase/CRISPR/Cas system CSM-associated protein Csm2 small subunit
MNQEFKGWEKVARLLREQAEKQLRLPNENSTKTARLDVGQCASLRAIADRITKNGILIADEVGMGKTRIAVEVARFVVECGGRVAILIPPGLGYQWQAELREGGKKDVPLVLRSLWAYLSAWKSEVPKPWFNEPIVVVSHAFSNWRLGEKSDKWRWALLPEIYKCFRKRVGPSVVLHGVTDLQMVCNAAESITNAIPSCNDHPGRQLLKKLLSEVQWPEPRHRTRYSRDGGLRHWLLNIIGLGLGVFDLVIVDEAHKSRGVETTLSDLLGRIVLQSPSARRLALTATPVELELRDWIVPMQRIGVDEAEIARVRTVIEAYAEAVKRVQLVWSSSPEAREAYEKAAQRFKKILSPYLVRRTKREDCAVKLFHEKSNLPVNEYRVKTEIGVELATLTPQWKQAVCAAEALSILTTQAEDPLAKRLRLTVGNGHGIAAVLDQVKQERVDEVRDSVLPEEMAAGTKGSKCKKRQDWWLSVIKQAFPNSEDTLFDHPAILAAVNAIEAETEPTRGEKVLVFGRFTAPMRALVDLLNAREMLRSLRAGQPWPQAKIYSAEWPAVAASLRQLPDSSSRPQIDAKLKAQYRKERGRRDRLQERLVEQLEKGLDEINPGEHIRKIFDAFKRAARNSDGKELEESSPLAIVSRALAEHTDGAVSEVSTAQWAIAFRELIDAASDTDDADNRDEIDDGQATVRWETLQARLYEEFNGPRGRFARLMNGDNKPESRRLIQLAFNRPRSFPRVLVAQSLVGREGLNLHKACRIVVMLHPEWNPGVMEQQIGRVDRVGSHWSKALEASIASGKPAAEYPRIEVRPVIFRGTYDEHQWQVLQSRWDTTRSQLNGEVIPTRAAIADPESRALIDKLSKAAPDFSPGARSA